MKHEIDIDLIAQSLRDRGHSVGKIIPVPDNGGEYEFNVDGLLLSLSETRALLQNDAERETPSRAAAPVPKASGPFNG